VKKSSSSKTQSGLIVALPRVAEDDGHLLETGLRPGGGRRPGLADRAGDDDPPFHHPEVLPPARLGGDLPVDLHPGKTGRRKKGDDLIAGVQPFGIELVGDHPMIGAGDHLARDEARAVRGEGAFPADKMLFVDPLPGTFLEILLQPAPVCNIEKNAPARFQHPRNPFEHPSIVLPALEVAETVPEKEDHVEGVRPVREFPCIALPEPDVQTVLPGRRPGLLHKIMGAIEALGAIAPACEFQGVPTLPAAEVQHALVGFQVERSAEEVDFPRRQEAVPDYVPVGLEIEVVEDPAPPFGPHMGLQVFNRSKGTPLYPLFFLIR